MATGGIKFDVQHFFDRKKVINALDRKSRTVLLRQGAFYRRVVKNSMKPAGKKGKSSKQGEPPRYHEKTLRQGIQFTYSFRTQTVVVGAAPLKSRRSNVPNVLEYGGKTVPLYIKSRRIRDKDGKRVLIRNRKHRAIKVAPRPFVGPKSINYPVGEKNFQELIKTVPLR